jgi:hypothetical protein
MDMTTNEGKNVVNAGYTQVPWTVDECPDANGLMTIRKADGSPNGDLDSDPIATVIDDNDASLIAAAPEMRLALVLNEQVLLELSSLLEELEEEETRSLVRTAIIITREALAKAEGR